MNAPMTFPPEALAESKAAAQALAAAKTYPVPTTHAEYASAGDELKGIKARANRLEEMRKKLVAPVLATQRAINEFFRAPTEMLAEAEKSIKRALGVYDEQQAELRREAERKAAEAARREQERMRAEAAAREAREKAEAKARAQREAEEAKARALEEAGRAEAAAARRLAAQEAEERRMQTAQEAEDARMRAAEATRLAAEAMPTAPVIHVEAPKVEGI